MAMEFSRVGARLYVGGRPNPAAFDYRGHGFQTIVFCAAEHQPDKGAGFDDLNVIRVPLHDMPGEYTEEELAQTWATAMKGAKEVAKRVTAGDRVLVTCQMGQNRSALVAALAMWLSDEPPRPGWYYLERLRQKRKLADPARVVLANQEFAHALLTLPPRSKTAR